MVAHLALLLALVLIAAKVGGEIATRLKQPPVLGELLAGMLVGNLPFPISKELASDASIEMLSQIGALILLFEVGLESTVRDVVAVGAAASRVAVLGTVGSFAAGWLVARLVLPDASAPTHVFLAASITATSVGITARVFKDIGQTRSREARTILGAAVLDDILGLVVLALVSGWIARDNAGASALTATSLLLSIGKTAVFLAAALFVGIRFTPQLFALAARLHTAGALLAVGLAFCFFLSWGAEAIGLAPIIGAFAAGLVLEDLHSARFVARGERSLAQQVEPISGFLVPIFFVVMGLRADVRFFARLDTMALAAALTLAAIVGKLFCAFGAKSGVRRLAVAIGMMPRGEVTLIFASLGATLKINGAPVLDGRGYAALVAVVALTTLLAPTSLKWTFASAGNLASDPLTSKEAG